MPYVIRQAVCLGIPVVDGTLVQATFASRRLLGVLREVHQGGPLRLNVMVAVAGDASATPEDLRYACQLEARRRYLEGAHEAAGAPFQLPRERAVAALHSLLGLALIVASGGHWLPALAGVWLLGLRAWLGRASAPRRRPRGSADSASISVRRVNHSGLAALRAAIALSLDEKLAYSEAYEQSVKVGLPEAAAIYTKLLQNPNPGLLSVEDGIWLPDAGRVREALTAGPSGWVQPAEASEALAEIVDVEVIEDDASEEGPAVATGPEEGVGKAAGE